MKKYYVKPTIRIKAVETDQDMLQSSIDTKVSLKNTTYGGSASGSGITSGQAKQSIWDSFDE